MLAWLWALVAFVAIHVALAITQPWCFRVAAYDSQWTVAHVAADLAPARPDVAFMGSSRVATGLDPAVVEREIVAETGVTIRAVNLAVTGATADTCRLVLKNLVPEDRQPKILVYGVYELEMLASPNDARVRQDLPYLSSIERLDDFADYARAPWRSRAWFLVERAIPIERDRRLVRDAIEIALTHGPAHDLYASGTPPGEQGFHPVPVEVAEPDPDRPRREYAGALARPRFSEFAAHRLERLIDLAQKRGIDVVLVDLPVTARHRSFWKRPEDVTRYRSLLAEIAARHAVPLLELYENPGNLVPDRGFTDTHHLNELGAAIVSRELALRVLAERFRASS